jgi:hypothetical protein
MTMLFTLEALKAKEGDCLLLHWGPATSPRIALIDGGPGNVYESFLRPRLNEIMARRGLNELVLDLAMVSHVDNDHVVGVKKLFGALRSDLQNHLQGPIRVERLWHNTFDDIIGNSLNAHYDQFTASFEASVGGEPKSATIAVLADALYRRNAASADEAASVAEDIALVLAGHGEGRTLRNDQTFLFKGRQTQRLNKPFGKGLITAGTTAAKKRFLGLHVQILGPLQPEIDALQLAFDAYLKKNNLNTAEAALAAYADKSVPNLSSIVCLIEAKVGAKTKSILLTGDARGDRIIAGLRQQGRLAPGASSKLHVDILKAPHHGSDRNVDPDFFKTLSADTYVFSGDGKHGNPERDTVDWLIASRGKTDSYKLVFTYPIATIDKRRKEEAGTKWNEQKHSLELLLDKRRGEGFAFEILEDAPVKIDLGSEKVSY